MTASVSCPEIRGRVRGVEPARAFALRDESASWLRLRRVRDEGQCERRHCPLSPGRGRPSGRVSGAGRGYRAEVLPLTDRPERRPLPEGEEVR